mmetsp:Transcript_33579/g.77478  ORF Transcript_33579/g.77478 Transcript_33579/m.77478 type:complete len:552 (-) Transcript_33579:226-1881(-)
MSWIRTPWHPFQLGDIVFTMPGLCLIGLLHCVTVFFEMAIVEAMSAAGHFKETLSPLILVFSATVVTVFYTLPAILFGAYIYVWEVRHLNLFIAVIALLLCKMAAEFMATSPIATHIKWTVAPVLFFAITLSNIWGFFCYVAAMLAMKFGLAKLSENFKSPRPGAGEPLRVLCIGDSFFPYMDGVQTFTTNTIQQLRSMNHEVHVFTSVAGPDKLFGVDVTRGAGMGGNYPGHSLTLPSPALFRALTFRPHLVHLFDTCPIALLTSFVLWLLDIPYVWSHHTRIDHYVRFLPQPGPLVGISVLRAFGTLMCNLCSTHMMVDDAMRNETPWLQNVDDDCKFFWKSGCDVDNFTPDARSESTRKWISGGRPDLPVIAFVGRMAYEKNIKLLPELIKKFADAGLQNKCRWVIVGHGPADTDIRSQLEGHDNVVFTGRLGKEELAKVYASADMLFNPTVTGGCDLVLLEAQAAGLAVVAPRLPVISVVVGDGIRGKLYEPLNMDDAKRAVLECIDDLERLKAPTRAHAEAEFAWPRVIADAVKMYRKAVTTPNRY